MKTKLLFTLLVLFASGQLFSQSLVLFYEGEQLEPNAEITKQGPVSEYEIIAYFDVQNTGSSTISAHCQRYEIDMVPGALSALCWGELCYAPTQNISIEPMTFQPNETLLEVFSGHYYPNGNAGISTIAFTFFDMDNPNDSVHVTILFDAMITGINDRDRADDIRVYPNPASDYLEVELNREKADENITIQLVNANGAVVRELIAGSQRNRINTSELAEGLYMYRALSNGELIASEKVIIKH
jgi:hypothetical protein